MSVVVLDLPKDTIVIQRQQVLRVRDYTCYNGEPFCTVFIERQSDGSFRSAIGAPDFGVTKRGTLSEVLTPLHTKFRAAYTLLFSLYAPTDAELWEVADVAGFRKQTCDVIRM